jgi:hypothetical protein
MIATAIAIVLLSFTAIYGCIDMMRQLNRLKDDEE